MQKQNEKEGATVTVAPCILPPQNAVLHPDSDVWRELSGAEVVAVVG